MNFKIKTNHIKTSKGKTGGFAALRNNTHSPGKTRVVSNNTHIQTHTHTYNKHTHIRTYTHK